MVVLEHTMKKLKWFQQKLDSESLFDELVVGVLITLIGVLAWAIILTLMWSMGL